MYPILNVAICAIRNGGNIIINRYYNNINYDIKNIQNNKNYHISLIHNIIYKTEKVMIAKILKFYPNHIILNQKNTTFIKKTNIIWDLQPIYGTKNFIKNIPHFCLSIAIYIKNKIAFSVIYDPIRDELFTAIQGKGTQLNKNRIRCNNSFNINNSIISISHITNYVQKKFFLDNIFKNFLNAKINLRITGCIILEFMYLSSGKLDFVIDFNQKKKIFDIGKLYIKESGGLVTSLKDINNNILGMCYVSNNKCMQFIKNIFK
ncbi:inositol monophosphatase family protein [Buchnera aphidicola]|uniref:inositol monophosphatase family protein n=1 Tax=Buchnera aphidicola TaxID=9 RepID=UPI0034649A4B